MLAASSTKHLLIAAPPSLQGQSKLGPTCRRQQNVDETVQELRGKGLEVKGMVCHVGNTEHRKALIQRAVEVGTRHNDR